MKKEIKKERRLKVTASVQRRQYYKAKFVPRVNLCGLWLADCGFTFGNELKIEVSQNQIIITKAA